MKQRLLLSVFPILLAMLMIAGSNKAEAASVGISIGGGHHYYGGGGYQYRTVDPSYTTWYPNYDTTTYVYTDGYYASPYYGTYSTPYYGNYSSPYIYSAPSADFNVWFGSGGSRHYGGHRR